MDRTRDEPGRTRRHRCAAGRPVTGSRVVARSLASDLQHLDGARSDGPVRGTAPSVHVADHRVRVRSAAACGDRDLWGDGIHRQPAEPGDGDPRGPRRGPTGCIPARSRSRHGPHGTGSRDRCRRRRRRNSPTHTIAVRCAAHRSNHVPRHRSLDVRGDVCRELSPRPPRGTRRSDGRAAERMMDSVLQDLRYALRTLQRAPLFTLVAVLTLGLGIGATTVVFTILNGVVLRPLQYEASDRLFGIWEQNEQGNYRLGSYPAFRDWRAQSDVFEALAYIRGSSDLMPGHDGARRVGAAFVSEEFFEVLRGQPLIGRLFSPDEQRPGGAPVAVLTHALWREAFGGDRRVIGSTIRLNAATYTVVGVLPDWFQFPSWAGVYLPLSTILPTDRILAQRGFHADSRIVAKLKPDVSIKQAQAAMAAIQSRLATAYPADNRGWTRVEFVSLFEEELRFGAVRPVLVLLAAAGAAVLLLACANVANMTLVRAARRSRDVAVRAALGAGRGRVARLLLTEAILVVIAGAGLGLLLARWATGGVRAAGPT